MGRAFTLRAIFAIPWLLAGCGGEPAAPPASAPDLPVAQKESQVPPPAADPRPIEPVAPSTSTATRGQERDEPRPVAQPVYRASDPPPVHDEERLARSGIRKYFSQRLHLYTDVAAEQVAALPELMDRAFDAWTEYFGPLPPDREGSEFVITGYLMADQRLFREAGLLPEALRPFPHGRNVGTRFWMNDQPTEYYRRHLLLHEGTHCFMTAVAQPFARQVWYMEGMAELFGTHRYDSEGRPHFRVMPHDRETFANLGRIRMIEDEVRAKGPRELSRVMGMVANEYLANPAYAWSWALCKFLDGHPRYHDAFRKMSHAVVTGDRTGAWDALFSTAPFSTDRADLEEEWLLFAADLCRGYDETRAVIEFRTGEPLPPGEARKTSVTADRGWQSSGIALQQGKSYQVTATGRFIVAHAPQRAGAPGAAAGDPPKGSAKPWESEPQGISIRYHAGRPVGMLLGAIRASPQPTDPPRTTLLEVIPLGREARFEAAVSGTLYLRLNDAWNELDDNAGQAQVEVREAR